MHVHVHMHMHMHVCMRMYVHACMRVCICPAVRDRLVCMHGRVCMLRRRYDAATYAHAPP